MAVLRMAVVVLRALLGSRSSLVLENLALRQLRSPRVCTSGDVSSAVGRSHREVTQVLPASSLTMFHPPLATRTCLAQGVSRRPSIRRGRRKESSVDSAVDCRRRTDHGGDLSQPYSERSQEDPGTTFAYR